jgi:hypothetical protein
MFAAITVCGNLSWRIERGRRRETAHDRLDDGLGDGLDAAGVTAARSSMR